MHSLEMCIRGLPRSSLGSGHRGADPEVGSRCCSEGLRLWPGLMAGLQKGNGLGLVGCLRVGQEPLGAKAGHNRSLVQLCFPPAQHWAALPGCF